MFILPEMSVKTDVNGNGCSSDSIKWFTVSKIRKWKNSDPRKWRYWDVETTSPGLLQHDNSFCWITAFFFKEDWKLLFLVDQKNSGCMPVTLEAQEHVFVCLFVCFFFSWEYSGTPRTFFYFTKRQMTYWLTVTVVTSELPQSWYFRETCFPWMGQEDIFKDVMSKEDWSKCTNLP